MSTLRTCTHYDGCPRKFHPVPKVRCGQCGRHTTESQVRYGVFDHRDFSGQPTFTGLVVRTGTVLDDGTMSWPAPYHQHGEAVAEYEHEKAAQKFADRENAR